MLFHSFEFFVLLGVVLSIYYAFPRHRLLSLALANCVFYAVSGFQYLLLFLAVAAITHFSSVKLYETKRSVYFYMGLAVSMLNLMFFKYFGFITENMMNMLGISLPKLSSFAGSIVLPVGISFYTFQLIAYLVDVKKERISPSESLLEFWVFIAFFGQLIAGPIMRAEDFLPQISRVNKKGFDIRNFNYAFYYISMGLAKKIILADPIAEKVEFYFSNYSILVPIQVWIAAYLFAFQIYFDFSSYSEIARGIGFLFGLDININFKSPYISANPSEFWTRWHITLSSWIRDYIYIPLGGSKKGSLLQAVFLMVAMSASGLWHGASWHFVFWGVFWGVMGIAHKQYKNIKKNLEWRFFNTFVYKIMSIFAFFNITIIGWIVFRAETMEKAWFMIRKMFHFNHFGLDRGTMLYLCVAFALYILHVFEYLIRKNGVKINEIWKGRVDERLRAAVYTGIVLVIILFTKPTPSDFIYFQF